MEASEARKIAKLSQHNPEIHRVLRDIKNEAENGRMAVASLIKPETIQDLRRLDYDVIIIQQYPHGSSVDIRW